MSQNNRNKSVPLQQFRKRLFLFEKTNHKNWLSVSSLQSRVTLLVKDGTNSEALTPGTFLFYSQPSGFQKRKNTQKLQNVLCSSTNLARRVSLPGLKAILILMNASLQSASRYLAFLW